MLRWCEPTRPREFMTKIGFGCRINFEIAMWYVSSPHENVLCRHELSCCIVQHKAHNNKFMQAFYAACLSCTRQTCKLNNNKAKHREKHQFTHCSLGCWLGEATQSMKENFQFAIRAARAGGMRENTWSQITSQNVNQYWLIFDCFPNLFSCWSIENWVFPNWKRRGKFVFKSRKDDSRLKNVSRMSFMCLGDIQQMINVELRDSTRDLTDKRLSQVQWKWNHWIQILLRSGSWRRESLNRTTRVWSGKLNKCVRRVFFSSCKRLISL